MRAYSVDLRARIVAAMDASEPPADVARRFGVSRRTVHRSRHQVTQRGTLAPRTSPGRRPLLDAEARAELGRQVAANPDATLDQHVRA